MFTFISWLGDVWSQQVENNYDRSWYQDWGNAIVYLIMLDFLEEYLKRYGGFELMVECCNQELMGHPNISIKDNSAKHNVDYGGSREALSEREQY